MEVYVVLAPEWENDSVKVINVFTNKSAAQARKRQLNGAWIEKQELCETNPYQTTYVLRGFWSVDYILSCPKGFYYRLPCDQKEILTVTNKYWAKLIQQGMPFGMSICFASENKRAMDAFVQLVYDVCLETTKMHENGKSFNSIRKYVAEKLNPMMEEIRIKA